MIECLSRRWLHGKVYKFSPGVRGTRLKCMWGCPGWGKCKCQDLISFDDAVRTVKKYNKILLLHTHDKHLLYKIAMEVERKAFLDGNYFAFSLSECLNCAECATPETRPCNNPKARRPSEHFMGIDVYSTVRKLGLPIKVVQSKEEEQNRYTFVLIS